MNTDVSFSTSRPVPDFAVDLAATVEAIQLLVPNLGFSVGYTAHECHAIVPDFHEPDLVHDSIIKRPSSMAEALRVAFIDCLEDGGFDPDHPPVSQVWCGNLASSLIEAHDLFPHLDLELGFVGGRLFAWMGTGPEDQPYSVSLEPTITLADAVSAVVALAQNEGRRRAA